MAFLLALIALVAVGAVLVSGYKRRARLAFERAAATLPPELAARMNVKASLATTPAARAALAPPVTLAPPRGKPHFVLTYDVGPDFLQRRLAFRDAHLTLAWKAASAGELVLAGALEEGSGHAMLLFRGSREAAERFAAADPYVVNGLVKGWRVQQWMTVVGETASAPTRPAAQPKVAP